jgi:hypothetical protein
MCDTLTCAIRACSFKECSLSKNALLSLSATLKPAEKNYTKSTASFRLNALSFSRSASSVAPSSKPRKAKIT